MVLLSKRVQLRLIMQKKIVESVRSSRNDGVTYCCEEESRNNHLFFSVPLITLLSVLFLRTAYCVERGEKQANANATTTTTTKQPILSLTPSKRHGGSHKGTLQTTLKFSKRSQEQVEQQQTGRSSHSLRLEDQHFHFHHKDT